MNEEIRGFWFPFRLSGGGVATAQGKEKLRQNVRQLLLTGAGERVMRSDYGGGVHRLVHDPNNDALRALLQHQIARAIGQWEPRVLLQEIAVEQQGGTVYVTLHYTTRRTRRPESISVPIEVAGASL